MGATKPVPPNSSYPVSIKSFTLLYDQPYTAPPFPQIDPSVDFARWTNELHDEVVSIETVIGINYGYFAVDLLQFLPGCQSIGDCITWLYNNTAPKAHIHLHHDLVGLGADDHPQYMRVDGNRGFVNPIASPYAWSVTQLAPLGQLTSAGWINTAQFMNQLNGWLSALGPQVRGFDPGEPLWDGRSYNGAWKIQGGYAYGYTDANGYLRINFNPPFLYQVQTFCFNRMPIPGRSHFGYVYQYQEDQLVPQSIDRNGATILFIEDIAVDRRAWVAMTWMAIGI